MFDSLSIGPLVVIFSAAAAAVWVAGISLSSSTDVLDRRLGLGEALGGLILLAIVTNLPEVAITFAAALSGRLPIAVGNILGGIAIQTVVLAVLDLLWVRDGPSLMYRAAALTLVLEAVLVVAVLSIAVMGSQLPGSAGLWRIEPASLAILVVWVGGVALVGRSRRGLPWHEDGSAPGAQPQEMGHSKGRRAEVGLSRAAAAFFVAALVTLAGGVVLEQSGEAIARHIGLEGVLFGATLLAAATALPEISTGAAAVKLGDYQLAVSDIFGGNSFLPVLLLLASVLAGRAVLPALQPSDIYLTGLGIVLTGVYVYGLVFRPRREILGMGLDSLVVVVLYVIGMAGLAVLTTSS